MSFVIKGKKHTIEEGTQAVVLVSVIDLGIQERGEYQGQALADAPMLGLTFELVDEVNSVDSGRPVTLFKEVTQSVGEKSTLFQFSLALHGGTKSAAAKLKSEGIDVGELLGKGALGVIGKTSTGNTKLVSLSPLMKGQKVKEPLSPLIAFSLDSGDEETYDMLPPFVKVKIESARLKEKGLPPISEDEFDV